MTLVLSRHLVSSFGLGWLVLLSESEEDMISSGFAIQPVMWRELKYKGETIQLIYVKLRAVQ